MSSLRIFQNVGKFSMAINRSSGQRVPLIRSIQPSASISTSKKNRDTTIATEEPQQTLYPVPKTVDDFANPSKKNYQYYGFIKDDPEWDINIRNHVMFFTVTIGLVGGGFIMMYMPDTRMKDWNQREAYIELARRESLGLPPIGCNVVPPEQFDLPTDEELGCFEIII